MNHRDKVQFFNRLKRSADYFQCAHLSPYMENKYFNELKRFKFYDIETALDEIEATKKYNKVPLIKEIKEAIEGAKPNISPEELLQRIEDKTSILGLLASREIRSFEMKNASRSQLIGRARGIWAVHHLDWERKARGCEYSEKETELIIEHGLDPSVGLLPGYARPSPEALAVYRPIFVEAVRKFKMKRNNQRIEPENKRGANFYTNQRKKEILSKLKELKKNFSVVLFSNPDKQIT